ncbi:MAG: hypothetical protein ACXVKA_03810 [Acidimicrobiia bacterium]
MAMRDPGTPGRNPFFDHGPDADLGDLADETEGLGDDPFASDWFGAGGYNFGPERPGPELSDADPRPGSAADPLGTLVALFDALQGAQPEASEHLVAAAHELVLAVKSVVDATEAVLAAQRAASRPSARPAGPADDAGHDPFSSDEFPSSPASGVRRIDLA